MPRSKSQPTPRAEPAPRSPEFGMTAGDHRPPESQEEEEARRRRQAEDDGQRLMDQHRALDDRQRRAAAAKPRREALRSMWKAAFGRGHLDLHARTTALHGHPVYQSLSPARRAQWDQFLPAANEAESDGNFQPLWNALQAQASIQADNMTSWDPPIEQIPGPDELAKLVPR